MTTRRSVLRLAGLAPATALLAACGADDSAPPTGADDTPEDLLLVQTTTGLAVVNTRDARVLAGPRRGVASWDGSVLVADEVGQESTRIEVRGNTGALRYGVAVPGVLGARVVSPGGDLVALASGETQGDTPYRPTGRTATTILIVGRDGIRHRLTLPGCVEPEAFGAQDTLLYVLDYLPPMNPDRYRVRVVDLATGALQPLYTRDKKVIPPGAEEQMRGQGRQAVYAAGHRLLFTLYTHQPEHEHTRDLLHGGARDDAPHVHAFVHTLSLDGLFAYCIDLPAPFGEGPPEGHAIALSRYGVNPIVVDATSGTLAQLDGSALTVSRIATFPKGGTAVAAAISPDDRTAYIGADEGIHVIRTGVLTTASQWRIPAPIRGLVVSADGRRLWVGQTDRALALDTASGREVASVGIPGLTSLQHAAT